MKKFFKDPNQLFIPFPEEEDLKGKTKKEKREESQKKEESQEKREEFQKKEETKTEEIKKETQVAESVQAEEPTNSESLKPDNDSRPRPHIPYIIEENKELVRAEAWERDDPGAPYKQAANFKHREWLKGAEERQAREEKEKNRLLDSSAVKHLRNIINDYKNTIIKNIAFEGDFPPGWEKERFSLKEAKQKADTFMRFGNKERANILYKNIGLMRRFSKMLRLLEDVEDEEFIKYIKKLPKDSGSTAGIIVQSKYYNDMINILRSYL